MQNWKMYGRNLCRLVLFRKRILIRQLQSSALCVECALAGDKVRWTQGLQGVDGAEEQAVVEVEERFSQSLFMKERLRVV